MLNKTFWEHRYEHQQTGCDLGEVSPPLKGYIDHLQDPSLRILIPGCGNGHEALYLQSKGFQHITVLDIAEPPLAALKEKSGENGRITTVNADFFEHNGTYDLILEQTFYCALDPSMRQRYWEHMHQLLDNNGVLAGVLFNVDFDKQVPPFGGNEADYRKELKPYFHIAIMEPCYNSIQPRMNTELFFMLRPR